MGPPAGGRGGRPAVSGRTRERRGKPAAARSSSSAANSWLGRGRSSAQLGDQLVVVPKGLHRMPPSAWSRLGAAWCRRSTRRRRRTAPISALLRPAKNLSAISSRSRGSRPASAAARARRRSLASALSCAAAEARSAGLRRQLGLAAAAAQLVEGGVAGDPEQPGARLAAAGVEARALAVGALEGGRGDFLGRRPVADEAGHVGVDVVAARPVEAVEGEHRPRAAPRRRERSAF